MGSQKYKQRHRELGLCTDCSREAKPGSTRCRKHNLMHNSSMAKTRKNLRTARIEGGLNGK